MGYSTCCPRLPGLYGRLSLADKRCFPDGRTRLERCATAAT
jgi:hypothetical protein